MVVKKKKKGGTKKKEKKEKDEDDEEEKCPIEFPEYQDPDIITPRAKLKIQLAVPMSAKLSKCISLHNIFSLYIGSYDFRPS